MRGICLLSVSLLALGSHGPARADSPVMPCCADVTVMSLDAEARRTVLQDRVQATLVVQREGKTAQAAQRLVNEKMRAALAMAKTASGVRASTGRYSTDKRYPPEPKPMTPAERERQSIWMAQQTLLLDADDAPALLELAGRLQNMDLALQGLDFYLSREAEDRVKDELLAEALQTVKSRAQKVAAVLGTPSVRFARIQVGGGGPGPPLMMRRMAADAVAARAEAMPAPIGEAGQTEVSLGINVEVHLGR